MYDCKPQSKVCFDYLHVLREISLRYNQGKHAVAAGLELSSVEVQVGLEVAREAVSRKASCGNIRTMQVLAIIG